MAKEVFTVIFEDSKELTRVIKEMNNIIKEYGYVSVADLTKLRGGISTYTEKLYGWISLAGTLAREQYLGGPVTVEFPPARDLKTWCKPCKDCTYASIFSKELHEATQAYCKMDCLATENLVLSREKEDLEAELKAVKKELEEYVEKCRVHTEQIIRYKGQAELWLAYSQSLDSLNDKMSRELDDIKLVVEAVKKDNKNLKTELQYLSNFLYVRLHNEGYITINDLGVLAEKIIGEYRNKED